MIITCHMYTQKYTSQYRYISKIETSRLKPTRWIFIFFHLLYDFFFRTSSSYVRV